jgi:hypothetical protein
MSQDIVQKRARDRIFAGDQSFFRVSIDGQASTRTESGVIDDEPWLVV